MTFEMMQNWRNCIDETANARIITTSRNHLREKEKLFNVKENDMEKLFAAMCACDVRVKIKFQLPSAVDFNRPL